MTSVEVLAPLRLETRFVRPELRPDGVNEWMLRLRIYPDEFSMRRLVPPPSPAELDRLAEAVAQIIAVPALSEADAFGSFAAAVGAGRALWLWRTYVVHDTAVGLTVDRTDEAEHVPFAVHGPMGLPEQLQVWFVHVDGTRELVKTLTPDLVAIGNELNLQRFTDPAAISTLSDGKLPKTWWLSYKRAKEVGLGVDLDIGLVPPALDALVVLGIGEADAGDLVDAHNFSGRMGVLAPGTPTNTVAGEPTTEFGERAESLYPLLHGDALLQRSSAVVLAGLTGRVLSTALPMLGGDLDYYGPGALAVQGFWPVLWGRYLRDVIGAGEHEIDLARWAIRHLAVEGPRPAFRVGEQPYGLLPASAFGAWTHAAGDSLAPTEARILKWALRWRGSAATAARSAHGRVPGVDTPGLLDVLGLHAPSRHWNARAVGDLYELQAWRALAGMPLLSTEWDDNAALALRDVPAPLAPVGPAPGRATIPGPPLDEQDDAEMLKALCTMHPQDLWGDGRRRLGLVGHLFRETLMTARAMVGDAVKRLRDGVPIALGQNLPWADEPTYLNCFFSGDDNAFDELLAGADPNGRVIAERFKEVREALQVFADWWITMAPALFRATLAALDTAAFRVDPWLTGIAERRLQRLIDDEAPFRLGAYGWVDTPAPYAGVPGGPLAPGPTSAGLLHAPSPAQALTAALLRDAAVRHPGSDQWDMTIDSAKIRAAVSLAERVRLGLHPYEALGLEVEKIAGDWNVVQILRRKYSLATDEDQQQRRVCDGQKVLRAAREGDLAVIAELPADLAKRLAPLDKVLDTYSDLLVADGVYPLVTGRADLANAAMEAAAGLGAPPELRAIRTPRQATTVRVSAWVLLRPASASGGVNPDPARFADPAYAAAVDEELGPGAIHPHDDAGREKLDRFAAVVGGAGDEGTLVSLTGGEYEGLSASADDDLRNKIAENLHDRLEALTNLAKAAEDALNLVHSGDAGAEAAVTAAADRWAVDLDGLAPDDPAMADPTTAERLAAVVGALKDRLAAAAKMVSPGPVPSPPSDIFIGAVKRAIRTIAGRPDLPVLPIVPRSLLPTLRIGPTLGKIWLEIVAAVRPRLSPLEARQLDSARPDWVAAVAAPDASTDPWHSTGPVVIAYGPGVNDGGAMVAIGALDGWTDSVPSRRHATVAAFGFNAPKSRAPQAVLVAVPPDLSQRLDNAGLLDVVLETRELVHARAPRQIAEPTLPHATSTAFVSATGQRNFLEGWPP